MRTCRGRSAIRWSSDGSATPGMESQEKNGNQLMMEPDPGDQSAPAEDLPEEIGIGGAARAAGVHRQLRRHADDEQEEREDQIRRRPSVPGRVLQRVEHVTPASGVVHQ